ncbi:MAG: DUF1983 domain-containing protein [Gammaproteobacteria bacterium]|nr:DUF1983 domain-containing protein [Gammaproteobacteria bacterium]
MSKPKSNMQVPISWSGQDKRFGDSVKENLDVIVGHRGDPLDKAITARDLLESGIATLPSGISAYGGSSGDLVPPTTLPNLTIPPAPTNLSASGAFQNVLLTWSLADYAGHAYVEVWRNATNNIATAARLDTSAVSSGVVYADNVGSGQSFYYWVRAVNQNGDVGPYNSSSGTLGSTATDTSVLLSALSGSITDSELASDLSTSIGEIGGIKTDVQDLEGQYTVKIDNNGAVAGYGLANTANSAGNITSEFIVNADRFAIMRGGSDTTAATVPFVVQASSTTLNGETVPAGVYMAEAFIKNGAITNAKIGNAAIDDAKIANLSAGKITSGTIDTSRLNIDSSSLTSVNGVLQVGDVNVSSLTGTSISASIMSGTTVYADKLTGDISKFIPFRTTSSTTFAGTETQLIEATLPASTHTDGHKPFASITGWYDSRADKVYRVRMYMRNTTSQSGTNIGTPASAVGSTQQFIPPSTLITLPAYVLYNGDLTGSVSAGMTLTSGSKVKSVSSAYYTSGSNQTRIYYTSISGGGLSTSDSITLGAGTSYLMVGESRFKANTGIAASFAISGAMAIQTTSAVKVKITIQRYSSSGYSADTNTSTDRLGELAGVLMGVR